MRKRFLTLALLALVCLLCCGCGSKSGTKYLNAGDREKLEAQLLQDLHLACSEGNSMQGTLKLENNTGYDLHDLNIRWAVTNEYIASITSFPAGARASLSLSADRTLAEKAQSAGNQLRIHYTVGAYSYAAQPMDVQLEDMGKLTDVEILVETANGHQPLEIGGTTQFPTGVEISGLSSARVFSLTTQLNPIAGDRFQLNISLEGKAPSGGSNPELVYKLFNSDGIVLESDYAYFTDDSATLYFSDADVMAAGRYLLRFEEYHG